MDLRTFNTEFSSKFEFSVNIECISLQTKAEHVDLLLAITQSYFKSNTFKVYAQK